MRLDQNQRHLAVQIAWVDGSTGLDHPETSCNRESASRLTHGFHLIRIGRQFVKSDARAWCERECGHDPLLVCKIDEADLVTPA